MPLPTPWIDEQDKLDRYINSFATQSFRDQADRDYVAARLACRYELFPQFLWASQQALEKYLKAILLYHRIKATGVKHDLRTALKLTSKLPFEVELSDRSKKFVEHIASVGEFRYLEVPYHIYGHVLIDLDLTVWELRRYCQILNVFGKVLPAREQDLLVSAQENLAKSDSEPRHRFHLHNGLLEKMISDKTHPSRAALLWQNACFSSRKRAYVSVKSHFNAQNPHLTHYPEMLDELLKFVFIPGHVVTAYRAHLLQMKKSAASTGKTRRSVPAVKHPEK